MSLFNNSYDYVNVIITCFVCDLIQSHSACNPKHSAYNPKHSASIVTRFASWITSLEVVYGESFIPQPQQDHGGMLHANVS